jgi:hypothetical protein
MKFVILLDVNMAQKPVGIVMVVQREILAQMIVIVRHLAIVRLDFVHVQV